MTEQWPTGKQFIDEWFEKETEENQLNQGVLSLIDQFRKGAILDEDELLKGLIAVSEREDGENADD